MESVIEGASNETISLAVDGLVWNGNATANNQNILYIAVSTHSYMLIKSNFILYIQVEYVKNNEYKIDSETSLSPESVYNELEQHVSPLDPNMSSVAQYSPIYTSDSSVSYNSPIVVTQLVANSNNNNNNTEVSSSSLSNNSSELGQVVSTRYLHMINDQAINTPNVQTSVLPHNVDSEQEVELLITDQNTGKINVYRSLYGYLRYVYFCLGISYSVSTQEYLVERCLADEQQLLENLSTETLLDSDLLALDENTLKSSLSEIIIEPNQKTLSNVQSLNNKNENVPEIRRSSRHISCDDLEMEDKLCKCKFVHI